MTNLKYKFEWIVTIILIFFVYAIPKSGTKVLGVPFYFGILAIALFILVNLKYYRPRFFLDVLPYWAVISLSVILFTKGFVDKEIIIRYFVGFVVTPIILNEMVNKDIDLKRFTKMIVLAGLFPVLYALIQLIFGMGKVVIPAVTVNISQLAEYKFNFYNLLTAKCNRVGEYYKLVSTYQNGNLFGLFLIDFYPLLMLIEEGRFKKIGYLLEALVIIFIFRTLSRTAIYAFVVVLVLKLAIQVFYLKRFKLNEFVFKITTTVISFFVLNTISKEGLFAPIYKRLFKGSSEEVITLNNRIMSNKIPKIGLWIVTGNPLYAHESFYFLIIFSLGLLIGTMVLFTLLYIDWQLFKNRKTIIVNKFYLSYVLAFVGLQIAAISDIGWGLFPIETQFWIVMAVNLLILKKLRVNFLPISFHRFILKVNNK